MLDNLKNILEKRTDNFDKEKLDLAVEKKESEKLLGEDFKKEQIVGDRQKKTGSKKSASNKSDASAAAHPLQKPLEVDKIESILSEGLEEIYVNLSARKQLEFKKKGEETAAKIFFILKKTKVKVKKIIKLIKEWLKTIPGVNKFFLEQEAKIKTDKIIDIK
ncbi:hypothetical protein KAS41_01770 [Candidatus Parcubacteria bacterium]|nr:hypothetical protein [Candidatus Parcubacteria bacterium]